MIGGGIVGAATALELGRRGHETLLLERNEAAGMGCSYGMCRPDDPLLCTPTPHARDDVQSLRVATSGPFESTLYTTTVESRALQLAAAVYALDARVQGSGRYSSIGEAFTAEFSVPISPLVMGSALRKGLLMVSVDSGMASIQDELRRVSLHGVRGELLGPDDVEKLEGGTQAGDDQGWGLLSG